MKKLFFICILLFSSSFFYSLPAMAIESEHLTIKEGKLIYKKSNEVVKGNFIYDNQLYKNGVLTKGYIFYKGYLYKNGTKYTGVYSKNGKYELYSYGSKIKLGTEVIGDGYYNTIPIDNEGNGLAFIYLKGFEFNQKISKSAISVSGGAKVKSVVYDRSSDRSNAYAFIKIALTNMKYNKSYTINIKEVKVSGYKFPIGKYKIRTASKAISKNPRIIKILDYMHKYDAKVTKDYFLKRNRKIVQADFEKTESILTSSKYAKEEKKIIKKYNIQNKKKYDRQIEDAFYSARVFLDYAIFAGYLYDQGYLPWGN